MLSHFSPSHSAKKFLLVFICCFAVSNLRAPQAKAMDPLDAVIVVSLSAVGGAILGASVIPFYGEGTPSDKKWNTIWLGAAIGAVVGVGICAYTGTTETIEDADNLEGDEEASLMHPRHRSVGNVPTAPTLKDAAPISLASTLLSTQVMKSTGSDKFGNAVAPETVVWSPLVTVRF